jgi:hypothetical protein
MESKALALGIKKNLKNFSHGVIRMESKALALGIHMASKLSDNMSYVLNISDLYMLLTISLIY